LFTGVDSDTGRYKFENRHAPDVVESTLTARSRDEGANANGNHYDPTCAGKLR